MKAFSLLNYYDLLEPDSLCGKYLKIKCVFHDESTASLYLDLSRDRFHCYGCEHNGDLFDFIMQMEECSRLEALKIYSKLEDLEFVPYFSGKSSQEDTFYSEDRATDWLKTLSFPTGERLSYLMNVRNLSPDTLRKFNFLEDCSSDYSIVAPIFQQNALKGVCSRTTQEIKPKYKYNPGFKKAQCVALHVENDYCPLLLTEGLLDAYSAAQLGYPNVASLLGSSISSTQLQILSKYDIICGLDPDEAGERGYRTLKDKFSGNLFRFNFCGFNDINEMLVNDERKFAYSMHKLIRR